MNKDTRYHIKKAIRHLTSASYHLMWACGCETLPDKDYFYRRDVIQIKNRLKELLTIAVRTP